MQKFLILFLLISCTTKKNYIGLTTTELEDDFDLDGAELVSDKVMIHFAKKDDKTYLVSSFKDQYWKVKGIHQIYSPGSSTYTAECYPKDSNYRAYSWLKGQTVHFSIGVNKSTGTLKRFNQNELSCDWHAINCNPDSGAICEEAYQ